MYILFHLIWLIFSPDLSLGLESCRFTWFLDHDQAESCWSHTWLWERASLGVWGQWRSSGSGRFSAWWLSPAVHFGQSESFRRWLWADQAWLHLSDLVLEAFLSSSVLFQAQNPLGSELAYQWPHYGEGFPFIWNGSPRKPRVQW